MGKIVKNWDKLSAIVKRLKKQGKKVVLTNGCFNILHAGHIRSLKDAKRLGDCLIVAVNDDQSVKKLKGKNYPLIPLKERLEILESLEPIDYLTTFSEAKVDKLLLKLRPHIHAKGTDYTKENVPERDTVLSYGGEIAIVGDPKNHSTTDIISFLANSGWGKKG
jgi:rfaE bifunctional protein nucleotidyltransferase chain/domain